MDFEPSLTVSPIPLQSLLPTYNDRAVLVGRTGSGKTTLAELMLRHYAFVAVLDAKRRISWEGFEKQETVAALSKSRHTHLIYAPTWQDLKSWQEDQEGGIPEFFEWVFQRGSTMVYVDEVKLITRGDLMPNFYLACLMQGRELDIGVLSSTQRPKLIPQVILSESEHYYVFSLQLSQDRDRITEVTGENPPLVREHEFAYKNVERGNPFARFKLNNIPLREGELANGSSHEPAPTPAVP